MPTVQQPNDALALLLPFSFRGITVPIGGNAMAVLNLEARVALTRNIQAVPFYDGLTLEEVGPRGLRWPERDEASKLEAPQLPSTALEVPPELESAELRLGIRRTLWSGPATRPSNRLLAWAATSSPALETFASARLAKTLASPPKSLVAAMADDDVSSLLACNLKNWP